MQAGNADNVNIVNITLLHFVLWKSDKGGMLRIA